MIDAFESENPFENPIFEFCNNINDEGVNQLVIAYDIGIKRLQAIVNQEIHLTEIIQPLEGILHMSQLLILLK